MPGALWSCADQPRVRTDGDRLRSASAFYLTALDGSDVTVCASPDERLSDVIGRVYPEGLPADAFTIMIGVLPDVLERWINVTTVIL